MNRNIQKIRQEFPALERQIYGKPYVYFDNAATTHKPCSVINRLKEYYESENSNIHRGVHFLSQEATTSFEQTRREVCNFINAGNTSEIIFTKGTTESINLVATAYGNTFLGKDDEILITWMEHHSNIVPWQMLCRHTGATLKVCPITKSGELIIENFEQLLNERTKLVAVTHVSNALGTINPIKEIISKAHETGAVVLIDGAQAVSHLKVDVQELDCDFYCFSGHKMYGPMGVGVLYGKEALLDKMSPYQGGGEMISSVTFEETTYNQLPFKFEAGTPNVSGVLGLGAAIKFINNIGFDVISKHENDLLAYGTEKLKGIGGITFYGQAAHKTGAISFNMDGIHPYDAGTIIDKFGVAVRTGHLCTQPLVDFYGIPGFIRASFAIYNTLEEIDLLEIAIKKTRDMLL
ncbi:MAG: cysteine desulfurase [Bacteroidales bacterium]|nr:cysteine desulfurase [Bacteroidales bacterium]